MDMAGGRLFCLAAVGVWAFCGVPVARADIINGDFSDGLNGYVSVLDPNDDTSIALAEVVNGQLHIRAVNTWTWNDGTQQWEGTGGNFVKITQTMASDMGFWAPDGTDAIEFDANVTIENNPPGNVFAGVKFVVNYNGKASGKDMMANVNQKITVDMSDLDPDGEAGIDFDLTTYGAVFTPTAPPETTYDVTVDAYFDNFRFVPEPGSVSLLLLGAAALAVRRRKRA